MSDVFVLFWHKTFKDYLQFFFSHNFTAKSVIFKGMLVLVTFFRFFSRNTKIPKLCDFFSHISWSSIMTNKVSCEREFYFWTFLASFFQLSVSRLRYECLLLCIFLGWKNLIFSKSKHLIQKSWRENLAITPKCIPWKWENHSTFPLPKKNKVGENLGNFQKIKKNIRNSTIGPRALK